MTDEPDRSDLPDLPAPLQPSTVVTVPVPTAPADAAAPAPTGPPPPLSGAAAATATIELASSRRLLTASFELLGRANEDMRRASFYIGSIVLGTVGPFALATWAINVVAIELTPIELAILLGRGVDGVVAVLGILAVIGIIVAGVESRTMAVALLGGQMAGRRLSPRRALARSRRVFWRAVVATIIVAIPLAIAQAVADAIVAPMLGEAIEASVVTTLLVTVAVGAPFAYVLTGIVLGDVDPLESIRRSFRLFRARRIAALIVVTFETIAVLLIFLGATAGLDIALRLLDAMGLGTDSGPAGLALVTGGIVVGIFAFGTLVFTVVGITVAPQVVMFVGLTHATIGLDPVRSGGADDPDAPTRPGRPRFRMWTRLMLTGFFIGGLSLAVVVVALTG